mmetsp:Transcript_10541/g.38224  ORF Transcript_10541/g.38224 Transcript_10541/m.38224 type:complete len:271 (-) Transcript_10541:53-865(-)
MMFHSASTISWYLDGSESRTSALSRSDLSSSSRFSASTFGFSKYFGCCSNPAYENAFLNATPSTRNESRMDPPITFFTPIILGSSKSWSSVFTASTHICAKNSFSPPTSLDDSVVIAHFLSSSDFSSGDAPSMETLISRTLSTAMRAAARNHLMMFCGCTPSSTNGFASRRNSPARMTTVVVPSPTSESCDFAMSTRLFAAGWTMSRSFMIVAPSLEIVVTPLSSCTSLSRPRGPSVVRMESTTAMHALMFEMSCPFPWDVSVPSRRSTI